VTVLINGESGTGKELTAQEIHNLSNRNNGPFIPLNCGAIAPSIIESTLFGHERGSFTGAVEKHCGVFEQADGGTLFLDEIGEMDIDLQTRFLRVLEEKKIKRLGGRDEVPVNFRLIAATNKDLLLLTKEGKFREDLFYRLFVFPITLPPLRKRILDIPLLVEHFLDAESSIPSKISGDAILKLQGHNWPGNIRELKNLITRASLVSTSGSISADDIEFIDAPISHEDEQKMDNHEKEIISSALKKTSGNKTKAADMLGIARSTITYKINRYGIDLENL
jgi:transcriptional regulator with PAS, ATPase and Fis domain